jgi:myo-inositol catabolism protein IolC
MNLGYHQALYVLPFDHRQSYVTDMFHFKPPLDATQRDQVIDSKQLIYEGFRQALTEGVPFDAAGILVDEQFGAAILRDARQRGYVTALSVERSGTDEFEFEYGADFASHIEAFDPTFAKVLVRYNPEGDPALNLRQLGRLKQLSEYCRRSQRRFMFELLVPSTDDKLARAGGNKDVFDRQARPLLMQQALHVLQDGGIEPDVWKVEGLDLHADGERMVRIARRGGRDQVGCIVLGRGADEAKVRAWLTVAAGVTGFIGFAVGRTSFWDAVSGYRAQTLTRAEAASQIAGRLREWVGVFEAGRLSHRPGTA